VFGVRVDGFCSYIFELYYMVIDGLREEVKTLEENKKRNKIRKDLVKKRKNGTKILKEMEKK